MSLINLATMLDPVELNRFLRADPALKLNMLQMGYLKPVPFIRNHNEQFETQYMLTREGEREMRQRIHELMPSETAHG